MSEVLDLVESYNEYLARLPQGVEYIYTKLRNKEIAQTLEAIKDFSEGLAWLEDAAKILQNKKVEVNLSLVEVIPFLEEINNAIEKGDFYLVADIFEYEILDYVKSLTKVYIA